MNITLTIVFILYQSPNLKIFCLLMLSEEPKRFSYVATKIDDSPRYTSTPSTKYVEFLLQEQCIVRIWVLTDGILRIRASFDGQFQEQSYCLVKTAWDDEMDDLMKDYRHRVEAQDIEIRETI